MQSPLTLLLPTLESTQQLGQQLGASLPAGSVLLLEGTLGTGKTSLVQGIAQGLGLQDSIVSPTFTLINEYDAGRLPLYHLDLYRLNPAEVASLYLEAYWEGIEYPPGIMAIEWAERLRDRPEQYLQIQLAHAKGDRRSITLTPVGQFDWGNIDSADFDAFALDLN